MSLNFAPNLITTKKFCQILLFVLFAFVLCIWDKNEKKMLFLNVDYLPLEIWSTTEITRTCSVRISIFHISYIIKVHTNLQFFIIWLWWSTTIIDFVIPTAWTTDRIISVTSNPTV